MNSTTVFHAPYKVSLLSIYVVLLIYIVVQLVLVSTSSNKKQSFYMFFLILSFLWTAFRVANSTRLLIPGEDTPFINALVWQTESWLTIQIQWAMFTCLLLYYYRLLSGHKWSDIRRKSVKVYAVTNAVGFVFVFALSAVNAYGASRSMNTNVKDSYNQTQAVTSLCSTVFNAYSSIMFLVLCAGMIVFSVRLCRRKTVWKTRLLNVAQTVVVNIVLSLVFISRALFDMYNSLVKYFTSKHMEIDYPDNGYDQDLVYYAALLLVMWEALPMFLLLITLAKDKAVEKRLFSRGHLQPGYGVFQQFDVEKGRRFSTGSDAHSVDSMEALLEHYDGSPAFGSPASDRFGSPASGEFEDGYVE